MTSPRFLLLIPRVFWGFHQQPPPARHMEPWLSDRDHNSFFLVGAVVQEQSLLIPGTTSHQCLRHL